MNTVISVENLGKSYLLNHEVPSGHASLREAITGQVRNIRRKILLPRRRDASHVPAQEKFWALRDINFELNHGDRLGIIGRNGAGKSTLLKILSRITEPTVGRVSIRGRVASLLEVGTGFHPELTGRENVFLNGTILGMSSRDIRSKFDEIVAFAGIERFLDTPVKRYSSGMYVRLAFSVAAHLEPDILVIDEVLAVGDAQFQKKCLGKIKDVTGEGRTVLFVSHNMTAVTSFCDRCLLLEKGEVTALGSPAEITARYYAGNNEDGGTQFFFSSPELRPGDDAARLWGARLVDANGDAIDHINLNQQIGVEMTYEVKVPGLQPVPNFHVFAQGQYAFVSSPVSNPVRKPGCYRSTMWIPPRLLNDGAYSIGLALSTMDPVVVHFYHQEALSFTVLDNLNDPARNGYTQGVPGVVRPRLEWSSERVPEVQTA